MKTVGRLLAIVLTPVLFVACMAMVTGIALLRGWAWLGCVDDLSEMSDAVATLIQP